MEHGNDTVNKPRDSRRSIDKRNQDNLSKKMENEKECLIQEIIKALNLSLGKSDEVRNARINKVLNSLGYSEIYNDLIKYLNSVNKYSTINNYFDTMEPPFSYYYNNKTAREVIESKGINDKNKIEEIIKEISLIHSQDWKSNALSKDKIEEALNMCLKVDKTIEDIDREIVRFKEECKPRAETISTEKIDKYVLSILENCKKLDKDVLDDLLVKHSLSRLWDTENSADFLNKLGYALKKANTDVEAFNKGLIDNDIEYIRNTLAIIFERYARESNFVFDVFRAPDKNQDKIPDETEKTGEKYGDTQGLVGSNFGDSEEMVQDTSHGSLKQTSGNDDSIRPNKKKNKDKEELLKEYVTNICELCGKDSINNTDISDIDNFFGKNNTLMKMSYIFNEVFNNLKIKYNSSESLKAPLKNLIFIINESFKFYRGSSYNIHQGIEYSKNLNDADYLLYALSIGDIDIDSLEDLEEFKLTVKGEKETKYTTRYNEFKAEMKKKEDKITMEYITQSLTARYEAAATVAEGRNFYESDFINFATSTNEDQPQSGIKVASNIDNVDDKLNHYGFKSNRTEHEEAALKYTAFDITFKNTFNLNNPIVEKLGAQQVDLRSDLFKYHIYDQDNKTFNQSARDKYVAEKLEPIGLTSGEIEELSKTMNGLPAEVEKNYEILSGNFDTDQDNFEKIAKIYALGEIIDNIKNLFKNGEVFSDNAKLGDIMGFELDETEPADIVGDCLLLKGKVNGTETKIKYDLRTGKLYMNALTQQEFNPPKITIGNDEPNTEIGDLGNFDNLLEQYQPTSFTQTDNVDYSKSSNENATMDENGDTIDSSSSNKEGTEAENKDSNQKTLEKLMENKLLEKLAIIGNTVREKAGEQSEENNVIDKFLKTFNILPNEGDSDTIEFLGGSNLYILLESIKNTNDEDYLLKFSKLMSELMSFCGLTRGKNNLSPKESDFDSVTIFNIDEKNATQDIISLQRANQSFFSDGEKDRIKGCECHFDSSVNLSFANIIVQKCCRRYGEGWKISTNHAQEFVDSVKKGIEDIRHDESDVVAMENMIEDESMWA